MFGLFPSVICRSIFQIVPLTHDTRPPITTVRLSPDWKDSCGGHGSISGVGDPNWTLHWRYCWQRLVQKSEHTHGCDQQVFVSASPAMSTAFVCRHKKYYRKPSPDVERSIPWRFGRTNGWLDRLTEWCCGQTTCLELGLKASNEYVGRADEMVEEEVMKPELLVLSDQ